jgi:hypothetical protein
MIIRCTLCRTPVDLDDCVDADGRAWCPDCYAQNSTRPTVVRCAKCGDLVDLKDTTECEGDALCSDCYTDGPACGECNGSGEGQADGTTCSRCHGRGQLPSPQDIEQTNDREEARAERWEEERCKQH